MVPRRRAGAVPVFFPRRDPHHVAGPDNLDRSAFALNPAAAGGDDQRLAQRVAVPGGAGARLECDRAAGDVSGLRSREERVDPHRAGEPFGRPLCGGLRAIVLDVHVSSPHTVSARSLRDPRKRITHDREPWDRPHCPNRCAACERRSGRRRTTGCRSRHPRGADRGARNATARACLAPNGRHILKPWRP